MMKRLLSALSALFPLLLSAQTIKVEAPNLVAADEMFNVKFSIEGEKKVTDFSWSPTSDFQLVYGPQKGSSSSMSFINGKMTSSVTKTFTYVLSPKSTGKFTFPAASATVDGAAVHSSPFSVEVVSNGAAQPSSSSPAAGQSGQPDTRPETASPNANTFLRLYCNRTRVVVGEPITVTLKLYTRESVSGFDDAKLPTFNGFWSQDTTPQGDVHFSRENLGNMIYDAAVLKSYVIIPQRSGDITIEPAELVCLVTQRVSSGGNSIFDGFFDDYTTVRRRVSTGAQKIHVSALPAGAPESFGGGVGKFSMKVKMSKDSLLTHEAASIVVTVSGKGNLSLLEAPKVSFPPDVEVYDVKATSSLDKGSGGLSGSRSWEYPFIPRSHGDFGMEPVRYSYYDVSAGKYVTLESQPLDFHVAKGNASDSAAPTVDGVISNVTRRGVKNLGEDVRFIFTKDPVLKPSDKFFLGSGLFWGLAALLAALCVSLFLTCRKLAARAADVAGAKTRKATKMALRRLKLAQSFLQKNLSTAFYEELHKALLGFISDKMNMPASDLSREGISTALSDGGVSEEVAGMFLSVLDACEFARYAPASGHEEMTAHYEKAVASISAIDSVMKGRKTIPSAGTAVLALLLALAPQAFAAERADSLWAAGNKAYTEGRWAEASAAWDGILEEGLQSPQLFYNIGNARFKDGDIPGAILFYERALKSDPSFADARYNLEVASSRIIDDIEPVPEFIFRTWVKKTGYLLDSDGWAWLFLAFLALAGGLVLLFLLSSSKAARQTGFFSGIAVLLLAFGALGFSISQKNAARRQDAGIVMNPVVSVKSSPSAESSTDLFVIHEGTRVGLLDSVGGWTEISLADGRRGWLRSDSFEVI